MPAPIPYRRQEPCAGQKDRRTTVRPAAGTSRTCLYLAQPRARQVIWGAMEGARRELVFTAHPGHAVLAPETVGMQAARCCTKEAEAAALFIKVLIAQHPEIAKKFDLA